MPRPEIDRPALHVPVETMNREFDGKLLLSLIAAEKGFDVYLGGRNAIHENMPALEPGIYLAKGARSRSKRIFELLDAFGHSIVALDEEALVRFDRKRFHFKLDPDTISMPRLLFAWGADNAEAWSSFPAYGGAPILEVGNPRIDMLRPELREFHREEIDRLRERYGEFVLINSNFAMVNHFVENRTRYTVANWVSKEEADSHQAGFLAHKQTIFDKVLAALPEIARAAAPARVIVRPHPSESPDTWIRAAAGLDNVTVIHEGPIAPWLMAASAVIHNSCTTAIEAAVVGTPVLWFAPVEDPDFDVELPNALSHKLATAEALAAAVSRLTGSRGPVGALALSSAQHHYLERHIAALDGTLSAERIVDEIIANRDRLKPARHSFVGAVKARVLFQLWLRKRAKRQRKDPDGVRYGRHKFPELGETAVNDRVTRLSRALGRFEGRRAVRVGPDQFHIV